MSLLSRRCVPLRSTNTSQICSLPNLPSQRRSYFRISSEIEPEYSGTISSENGITTYHEHKMLPYSRRQLYRIVADVDSYSTFIPFCSSSRVLSCSPSGSMEQKPWLSDPGKSSSGRFGLEAELRVGFKGLDEAYTSRVECRQWDLVKAVAADSSLFHTLSTTWRLFPARTSSPHPTPRLLDSNSGSQTAEVDQAPTLVGVDIAFKFRDPIHDLAAGMAFSRVSRKVMMSFEKRCRELYGL